MKKTVGQVKKIFIPSHVNAYRPRILERRVMIYYLIVILIVEMLFLTMSYSLPRLNYFADVSAVAILDLVNQRREAIGLGGLRPSEDLNKAAAAKAKDMIDKGYFSHFAPDGTSPWYWIAKSGYNYVYAGENLAKGFIDARSVFDAWLRSDSHRANILNPHYGEIGVSVVSGLFQGRPTTLVVQMFGSRQKEASSGLAAPATANPSKVGKLTSSMISDFSGVFGKNLLLAGFGFIFLIFVLNIVIKFKVQHGDLILNGLLCLVIILGFLILNSRLIGLNLQILGGLSV